MSASLGEREIEVTQNLSLRLYEIDERPVPCDCQLVVSRIQLFQ